MFQIFLSDEEFDTLSKNIKDENKSSMVAWEKLSSKDIVFEDADLLVINKNSWINVHPWDHKTTETNVIYQVQDYLWDKLNSLTFKPSLAHRIDRDTSGILMIAKKKEMLVRLVADFKDHKKIKKTYFAVVVWKLWRKKWTIKANLLRIENAKDENKVQVNENWLSAVTHYKLLKEHIMQTKEWVLILSEIEVQIETGRMHQIRVHMASIWNPIVWDKAYWDKKVNSFLRNNYWLTRQALHAWKIEFFHYGRDKVMELEARLKDDLIEFLEKLK